MRSTSGTSPGSLGRTHGSGWKDVLSSRMKRSTPSVMGDDPPSSPSERQVYVAGFFHVADWPVASYDAPKHDAVHCSAIYFCLCLQHRDRQFTAEGRIHGVFLVTDLPLSLSEFRNSQLNCTLIWGIEVHMWYVCLICHAPTMRCIKVHKF
jgi:hypothetical protein